jgi:predicted DNA-binding protein
MADQELKLAIRVPEDLAAELEQLAKETGRTESHLARCDIIEFLEDCADYRYAVAVLERGKGQPNLTLEEAKKQLGLAE